MMALLTPEAISALLLAAIGVAIPLMLAGIGETIGERAGVLNLGVEGVMLVGAYVAFVVALGSGSAVLGIVAGIAGGMVASLLMLVLCVWLGLNQIVVGLAITLAGEGLTTVLYDQNFSSTTPRLGGEPALLGFLSDIPVIGPVLFGQPWVFWVVAVVAIGVSWMLRRTNWGLANRAAGQKPGSLDSAGGSVLRSRTQAVLLSGAFAGLGGAYLAVVTAKAFTPHMTEGLGFIAIVVAMLSRGSIAWVAITSLIYGLTTAVRIPLQLAHVDVSTYVLEMIPYVAVILTLLIFARTAVLPPALGAAYTRGAR